MNPLDDLLDALETLHREIVDLEAMAHAAAEVLQHMPYLPRVKQGSPTAAGPLGSMIPSLPAEIAQLAQLRQQFGRLFALVAATADSAADALGRSEEMLLRAQELRARLDSEDGLGPGRSANEGPALYGGRACARGSGSRTRDQEPRWPAA